MNATYYAERRKLTDALSKQFPEGFCLMTSTGKLGAPGNVSQVSVDNAARLILEGSHKLASQDESEAWQATMEINKARSVPVNGLESARALFAALQGKDPRK